MRSASNRDVFQHRLQVLHVHVLLVAPLGAGYMSQSGTDQHQGRVSVRERPHHTGPAADLSVQPFNHIVGADPCPMLIGEITEGGQRHRKRGENRGDRDLWRDGRKHGGFRGKECGKDDTQSRTAHCGHGIHCVEQSHADVQENAGGDQQARQDGPGLLFAG